MAGPGRPKAFDPDKALDQAMRTFWLYGYAATSLDALTSAMGIQRPSLYREFGGKEALFLKTIDRYLSTVGEKPRRALVGTLGIRDAIEQFFYAVIDNVASRDLPPGCLVACVLADAAPLDRNIEAKFKECLNKTDRMIRRRLDRAVAQGELDASTDVDVLAKLINSLRHGLSVRARSGERAQALRKHARLATALLITSEAGLGHVRARER